MALSYPGIVGQCYPGVKIEHNYWLSLQRETCRWCDWFIFWDGSQENYALMSFKLQNNLYTNAIFIIITLNNSRAGEVKNNCYAVS